MVSERVKIVLKLSAEAAIGLVRGKFISDSEVDTSRLNDRLSSEPELSVQSLFDMSPGAGGDAIVEPESMALRQYYTLFVSDPLRARNLVDELNTIPYVEDAYIEPVPGLPA